MVYVHGGGWTGGDPQRQARDLYHTLALDGWATMAIRYPFTPHVSVEAAGRRRAGRRSLGPYRPGRSRDRRHPCGRRRWIGRSPPGHDGSTPVRSTNPTPSPHVSVCTASTTWPTATACAPTGRRSATRSCSPGWSDEPDRYDDVSPLVRVTDDSPPMLIVHGERDTLVPIGEAEQFVAALVSTRRPGRVRSGRRGRARVRRRVVAGRREPRRR